MSTTTSAKPIAKIISLTLNGFHGYQSHNVRAIFEQISGEGEALEYQVSIKPTAARKFECRSKDCTCGESMPEFFTADGWDFDHSEITVNGAYPQR